MSAQATTSASTAEPASSAAPPARRRRRSLAEWSPGGALGITLLALVVGQPSRGAALLIGGSKDPTWLDGAVLIIADVVTLAVIVFFARRGADRLGAATFGLRRTDATAALGWVAARVHRLRRRSPACGRCSSAGWRTAAAARPRPRA